MPPNRQPSPSNLHLVEKTVGTKSLAAIESDWLEDYKNSSPRGRPEGKGWLTIAEMAAQAGRRVGAIYRWVASRPEGYWETAPGSVDGTGGPRRTTYYRPAISRRRERA